MSVMSEMWIDQQTARMQDQAETFGFGYERQAEMIGDGAPVKRFVVYRTDDMMVRFVFDTFSSAQDRADELNQTHGGVFAVTTKRYPA